MGVGYAVIGNLDVEVIIRLRPISQSAHLRSGRSLLLLVHDEGRPLVRYLGARGLPGHLWCGGGSEGGGGGDEGRECFG